MTQFLHQIKQTHKDAFIKKTGALNRTKPHPFFLFVIFLG
ncbi:hypothetical protein [uncultured Gammaproteobacteria bacterium]|nr:hypothetical protein [uncultured Gammaproteobacteria bacterium]